IAMRRTLVSTALAVGLLLASRAGATSPESNSPSPIEKATAAAARERDATEGLKKPESSPSGVTSALPDAPGAVALTDPVTRPKYLTALQRFYDSRANGYDYRSRVFEWQLLSSRVIFLIVLLLVGAGIYFAAVQFHVALATARRGVGPATPGDADRGAGDSL